MNPLRLAHSPLSHASVPSFATCAFTLFAALPHADAADGYFSGTWQGTVTMSTEGSATSAPDCKVGFTLLDTDQRLSFSKRSYSCLPPGPLQAASAAVLFTKAKMNKNQTTLFINGMPAGTGLNDFQYQLASSLSRISFHGAGTIHPDLMNWSETFVVEGRHTVLSGQISRTRK